MSFIVVDVLLKDVGVELAPYIAMTPYLHP